MKERIGIESLGSVEFDLKENPKNVNKCDSE